MEPVTDNIGKITPKEKMRKPLQVLQPAATNKETLVGADRTPISIQQSKKKAKGDMTKMIKKGTSKCKKITSENKAIQTAQEEKIKIQIEDLTSTANPSENYWQILAERRKIALKDTLEENKKLVQLIEKLQEEKRIYKEMYDEVTTLIEILQEEIENRDDINLLNDGAL